MANLSTCPKVSELEQLSLGHAPANTIEGLMSHLEACPSCLARIKTLSTSDTLVDVLGKAKTLSQGPQEAMVVRLIEKLTRMPPPRPADTSLKCGKCGKSLRTR